MMARNDGKKFGLLSLRTEHAASDWIGLELKCLPKTAKIEPGSREAFELASRRLLARATLVPALRHLKDNAGVMHGFDVIFRALYMYAVTAQHQRLTVAEFGHAICRDESFRQIEPVTVGMSNRLAARVEHRLQLAHSRYSSDDTVRRAHYRYSNGVFTIESGTIVASQRIDIVRESRDSGMNMEEISQQINGQCKGQRLNIVRPIFMSAAKVVTTDPALSRSLLNEN